MIQENENMKIDIDNLKRIRELLLYFEAEHLKDTNRKGKKVFSHRWT